MLQLIEENWLLLLLALLIGVAIAWYVFRTTRKTRVTGATHDPLDEGAERTKRNQALIDSPPVAVKDGQPGTSSPKAAAPQTIRVDEASPRTPAGTTEARSEEITEETIARNAATDKEDAEAARTAASPGPTSATANADSTAASPLGTDAETGDGIPMREAMKQVPPEPDPDNAAPQNRNETKVTGPAPTKGADDLTRIKGIGPKLVGTLHELGVTSLEQIANWTEADVARIDSELGRFQGRIERDGWIEQARLLNAGDTAAYEAKYGKTSGTS